MHCGVAAFPCSWMQATRIAARHSALDQIPVFVPEGAARQGDALMWESCARLIVASANVTRSGYRKTGKSPGRLIFSTTGFNASQGPYDAIDFLQGIVFWSRADSTVLDRLRNGLQDARDRVVIGAKLQRNLQNANAAGFLCSWVSAARWRSILKCLKDGGAMG